MTVGNRGAGRSIARATLVAGTLDILSACVYAAISGRTPGQMLTGVASAIGADTLGSLASLLVGLALHFAIMAVMAAVYVLASGRFPALIRNPLVGGVAYGLLTWAVMNLVVLPLRWPALFPKFGALALGEQMFSHVVLVGIPIALIAAGARRA